jgi:hypothetical protein
MKTWKKIVLGLTALGVVALAVWIAIDFSSGSNLIIPAGSSEYHTKEELTDLYWQNKTVLNAVKDSVLSNKGMTQELIKFREGHTGILTDHQKDFFSEEEWENIVSVFERLHPYMIMLELRGRSLKFYIDFSKLKLETRSKYVRLYWFPSEKELENRKERSFADSIEVSQLDGNWYIVEEIYPW